MKKAIEISVEIMICVGGIIKILRKKKNGEIRRIYTCFQKPAKKNQQAKQPKMKAEKAQQSRRVKAKISNAKYVCGYENVYCSE